MLRDHYLRLVQKYFSNHPIVCMLGPRQCGKTTLAKAFTKIQDRFNTENYFDLENPLDIQRLANPVLALKPLKGLIVIDEIQRMPELFTTLRYIVDHEENEKKILILGIAYLELTPFTIQEASLNWREFYIRTFLEQDIPSFRINIPPAALRRFWTMLAHYHGNIFNASEVGRSFGSSDVTMRKYLDILSGMFMIRQLQPWFENISKRQVKAPKIYFRDSGIFHSLLQIESISHLRMHPKLASSWEGFALEEVIRLFNARAHECYFWSTYTGAELDLIIQQKSKLLGFKFVYTDKPSLKKSMKIALQDLQLDHIYVLHPGDITFKMDDKITAHGLSKELLRELA